MDNSKKDDPENTQNRLFKIEPVLNYVRNNCLSMKLEPVYSVDEQIFPAKTKYNGICQYNPKNQRNGVSRTL